MRQPEPELALDVMVVVNVFVMVTVVMFRRAKGRAGKHHRKQGGNQKLLHSRNRSMSPIAAIGDFRVRIAAPEPNVERGPFWMKVERAPDRIGSN